MYIHDSLLFIFCFKSRSKQTGAKANFFLRNSGKIRNQGLYCVNYFNWNVKIRCNICLAIVQFEGLPSSLLFIFIPFIITSLYYFVSLLLSFTFCLLRVRFSFVVSYLPVFLNTVLSFCVYPHPSLSPSSSYFTLIFSSHSLPPPLHRPVPYSASH